jgi:lipid II:glycine glycyltransferase (peptidoglycan interpeptide bridge formation enzyme)
MTAIADSLAPARAATGAGKSHAAAGLSMERLADEAWEGTIADFGGVCQEQLLTFARLRWPKAEHEPVIFRTADGELVGGCLIMIQRVPLGLGALAVAKWGPMLRFADRADAQALYEAMVDKLIEEYADRRGMFFSMLPRATLTATHAEYLYLMARGFEPGSRLLFPNRYIVNLRLSDAEQRKSLEQKWRYHLNKSEKAGLSFEHAGPDRLADFDALYAAMMDRKKFPDHSAYGTVATLLATPSDTLRPELFYVWHQDRIVAGAVIFKAGDRAVYLYGATLEEALELRAGYFLHWNIIRWLRDNTPAAWYELGGTDGFKGLHQFKKGMVGSAGVIAPIPRFAYYASNPMVFMLGRAAFAARDVLHHVLRLIDRMRPDRAKPDQPPHVERDPRGGL